MSPMICDLKRHRIGQSMGNVTYLQLPFTHTKSDYLTIFDWKTNIIYLRLNTYEACFTAIYH